MAFMNLDGREYYELLTVNNVSINNKMLSRE